MPRKAKPAEVEEVTDSKETELPAEARQAAHAAKVDAEVVSTNDFDPKQAKNGVKFLLNNLVVKERTFTEEDHGEDFVDVASEFASTHKKQISGIVYL